MIVLADKGNATVLMDRDEYVRKALTIIEHKPFEVVKRCPARQIETTLNKFLWRLFQERRITKPLYNRLHASECPLPRFYGMAKIHKPEVPLRPVISAVGSALYAASKYLAQILKPLVGNDGYTVANSKEFVKSLIDVRLSEDEELVSFDVQSLYTSLPVQRALSVVREVLEKDDTLSDRTPLTAEEVTGLLKICLTSTFVFIGRKVLSFGGWCSDGFTGLISRG